MTGEPAAGKNWNTAILYGCIASGSVAGGVDRDLISLIMQLGPGFPWATLFVNVTGSFIIGFYSTLSAPDGRLFASARQRQFVTTGFCGGYTTFSTFSLETFKLLQAGMAQTAFTNIAVSIVSWLLAVWLICTGKPPQPFERELTMQIPKQALLLRIFIGEDDCSADRRCKAIVIKAREALAGATVLRGPMGFGASSRLHDEDIASFEDLPLVIEIVDSEEKINGFLPMLDEMMTSGLDHAGKGSGSSLRIESHRVTDHRPGGRHPVHGMPLTI